MNKKELLEVATRIFNNPELTDVEDLAELETPERLAELIAENPLQAISDLLDIIENNPITSL